jgi:hypothetical protein
LRGSSEFHAWGDSNLYLRRIGDDTAAIRQRRRHGAVVKQRGGGNEAVVARRQEAVLMSHNNDQIRRIYTDGRSWPADGEYEPTYAG